MALAWRGFAAIVVFTHHCVLSKKLLVPNGLDTIFNLNSLCCLHLLIENLHELRAFGSRSIDECELECKPAGFAIWVYQKYSMDESCTQHIRHHNIIRKIERLTKLVAYGKVHVFPNKVDK